MRRVEVLVLEDMSSFYNKHTNEKTRVVLRVYVSASNEHLHQTALAHFRNLIFGMIYWITVKVLNTHTQFI